MNNLRHILIDPEKQTIEEVFLPKEDLLNSWYKTIGNNCTLVTSVSNWYWDNVSNSIICDDEILLREDDIKGMFEIKIGNDVYWLLNKALVSGYTMSDGVATNCSLKLEWIKENVTFKSAEDGKIYAKQVTTQPNELIWWGDSL